MGNNNFKVVPEGFHGQFFDVNVKAVQLIGGRRFLVARSGLNERTYCNACPNHTDDGMHSDHGYLDTCNNPLGPP